MEMSKGRFILANKDFLHGTGKKVTLHFLPNHNISTIDGVRSAKSIFLPQHFFALSVVTGSGTWQST